MPYGLSCESCPRDSKCGEWGSDEIKNYKHEGKPLLGVSWEKCPVEYLKDPNLLVALDLYSCSQVSALSGWPNGFSAWATEYLNAIHQGIEEIKRSQVNQWHQGTLLSELL